MIDIQNKNKEKNYKTDEKCLAEEIAVALDDYFTGPIEQNEKSVLINLENGQIFRLTVDEIIRKCC